ncbi:MAG TPA: 16S rRNA (guanine(966)-N(2))-methyltransferase RsmD, partial [Vicinamibacterales bacterium]|nr:16S rRNA (guanine(966)-N(2))-methyltransferase RsmD [Vicinamibacterales bacterium]
KGRTLQAPTWDGLRPTSDRLRETLFNVVAPTIRGARVLDGYAGTGAVGIEALSRGASEVVFVEKDRRAVALIEANLARCGVRDRHAIIRSDLAAATGLARVAPFDLVFLDPPYGRAGLDEALHAGEALVTGDTLLIIEHARRDEAPASQGSLQRTRTLHSGDSALAFYRLAHDSSGSVTA